MGGIAKFLSRFFQIGCVATAFSSSPTKFNWLGTKFSINCIIATSASPKFLLPRRSFRSTYLARPNLEVSQLEIQRVRFAEGIARLLFSRETLRFPLVLGPIQRAHFADGLRRRAICRKRRRRKRARKTSGEWNSSVRGLSYTSVKADRGGLIDVEFRLVRRKITLEFRRLGISSRTAKKQERSRCYRAITMETARRVARREPLSVRYFTHELR